MKKSHLFLTLQFIVLLAMLLSSCTAPQATPQATQQAAAPTAAQQQQATTAPQPEAKRLKIGYTLHAPVPFTEEIKFGALQAAKDFGVDVEVVAPDKYDPQQQISLFEGFISKGVDGLVTVPQGDVWKKVIDDTVAKGIPVMTANVFSTGSKAQIFVGEDGVLNGT